MQATDQMKEQELELKQVSESDFPRLPAVGLDLYLEQKQRQVSEKEQVQVSVWKLEQEQESLQISTQVSEIEQVI